MAKNFFKFSLGAISIIAASLLVFYFLQKTRYERQDAAFYREFDRASVLDAALQR
ncbi:MAG: hypothetical protein AAB846_01860 [Patescibacteria group bacterium]